MNPQTKREYDEKHERRTKARKKKAKDYREPSVLVNSMADGNVLYSYTSKINPEGKMRPLTKDRTKENMLRFAIAAIKKAVGIRTKERAEARRSGKGSRLA